MSLRPKTCQIVPTTSQKVSHATGNGRKRRSGNLTSTTVARFLGGAGEVVAAAEPLHRVSGSPPPDRICFTLRRVAFFRLVQGPLAEVCASGDVIGRIVRRELDGVIVRGAVDPGRAAEVVGALEAGSLAVPRRRFAREFEAFAIGPCLDQAEHGTEAYFDAVPTFEDAAHEVLGNEVEEGLATALAALAAPKGIVTPRDASGQIGRASCRERV